MERKQSSSEKEMDDHFLAELAQNLIEAEMDEKGTKNKIRDLKEEIVDAVRRQYGTF